MGISRKIRYNHMKTEPQQTAYLLGFCQWVTKVKNTPYFTPAAIPGLFVGCLLSNILGGAAIWDIIFGSIATLIGAIGTYALRKNKWLAPLPPIIANTLIVPFVLRYAYGSEGVFAMFFVTIGASEFIVCGIIGMLLLFALNPVRNVIFKGVE